MKKNYFIGMICFALVLMTGGLQAQVQLDVDGDTNIRGSLNVSKNSLPKGFSNVNNVFIELDLNHNFLSRDISQVGGVFRIDSRPNDPLFSWRRRDPGSEPLSVGDVTLMALRESGNLGIGNHNPQTKLDVNGSIRAASGNSVFVGGITSSDEDGIRLHQINSNGYIDHKGSGNLNFRVDNVSGSSTRMVITSDGKVGVGTTAPTADIHIKQNAENPERGLRLERSGASTNYWETYIDAQNEYRFIYNDGLKSRITVDGQYVQQSDKRLKRDISQIEKVLEKVLQLKPSTYYYKATINPQKKSWGFIAQEVEEFFPEFVSENDGYKGIAYDNFAILSIKAIQELHAEIENKDGKIEALETQVTKLEDQFKKLENLILSGATGQNCNIPEINNPIHQQQINLTAPTLKQNQPNPFNGQTTIQYFLPETTQKAQIQITDINGKVLKMETIQGTGHGQLNLDAKAMPKGTYAYSLLVDGQLVETKQMILVK